MIRVSSRLNLIILAASVSLPEHAGAAAKQDAPIPIDLSAAVVTQSNCKTPIGCGHPSVTITKSSAASDATAGSPAQHILAMQVEGPIGLRHGPYSLDVEYELANPSGHGNNLLCASAIVNGGLVQRCANAYSKAGRLSVPLHSPPTRIGLQFGLMPWSRGHRFAVRNVRLSAGQGVAHADKSKGGSIDLTAGRLLQADCATPIGCTHKVVTLTPDAFTSIVAGQGGEQSPAPGDNPNLPPSDNPPVARTLSLEVPVPARGKSVRALAFRYQAQSAGESQPQIVVRAQGRTIVESVVDKPGGGLVSMEWPESSLPVETVTFAFVPRGAGPVRFEVSGVSLGPRSADGATPLPATEDMECEDCVRPASRRDPCGPELLTFWVTAADSREGRGVRCVSNDLRSWYGEGWWIDPSYGWYRHLGYIPDASLDFAPGFAIALDFGVMPAPAEGDGGLRAAYGTSGAQILHIDRITPDRWHVSTSSRSWNEEWQLIPKGELLPSFLGSVRWEKECGSFGLYSFEAAGSELNFLKRCAIPADLTADPTDTRVTSLPIVWYGESYVSDPQRDDEAGAERAHLGWLTRFAGSLSPHGFYGASDRCLAPARVGSCTSLTDVTAEVIGPGASDYPPGTSQDSWENGYMRFNQGLYMVGPDVWGTDGAGHGWIRHSGLPPGAALPAPTEVRP